MRNYCFPIACNAAKGVCLFVLRSVTQCPLRLVTFYDGTEDLFKARPPPFDIVGIVVEDSLCG